MTNYSGYRYDVIEKTSQINYVQVAILTVLSCLIIAGNVVTLSALHTVKKFQKTTKLFILSLSIADLLVGAVLIPIRLNEILLTPWSVTITWCKLSISFNIWNLWVSSFNLLALSVEKLLFLSRPLEYDNIVTTKKCIIIILAVWMFFTSISFIPIFSELALRDTVIRHDYDHMCKYATTLSNEYMIFMSVCDVISLVLLGLIYFRILQTAQRQVHKMQRRCGRNNTTSSEFKQLRRTERRNMKMLVSLVGIFYICWIPAIVAEMLSIEHGDLVTQTVIFCISALVYLNSFLNSTVYYFFNDEFRKFVRKCVHKQGVKNGIRMREDFMTTRHTAESELKTTRNFLPSKLQHSP